MVKQVSEETRRKLSLAGTGRRHSPETIEKMREYARTRIKSAEERAKLSAALKGKPSNFKGKKQTEEALWKMREAHARQGWIGPNHPQWRGGVSFEPYCVKFSREFKERVRVFFGRKCAECGKTEEESGYRFCIHHVNFRKDACCADDVIPLFVPLCRSCHSKTNFNREYWEERFTTLINGEYGGKCYLPKAEAPA